MKRNIVSLLVLSSVLGLLFDLLFYGKALGISLFLYTLAGLAATSILAARFKVALNKSLLYVAPLIIFFAAMTFIRASGLLTFLNVIVLLYLVLILMQLIARPNRRLSDYQPGHYFGRVLWLPFQCFGEMFVFGRWLTLVQRHRTKKQTVKPVLRGILLSLPFLVIFLILFASADLVFKKYVTSIFAFHVSGEFIFRALLVMFVAALAAGSYALLFMRPAAPAETDQPTGSRRWLGPIETSIVLGSINLLFLLFVLVQLTYFFGGQTNISRAGFTYADYARRGFFELLLVAVISWLLIWGVTKITLANNLRQRVTFMWLSGLLVLEVFVIMLSAVRRLSLYEATYGFTTLRLYSHLFIGWLAVAFVLILIHIFREQKDRQFTFHLFLSVVGFFVMLNFINPDATIARQNIKRFDQTGKIDIGYLASLSEDATPQLVGLLKSPNQDVQKSTARKLYYQQVLAERMYNHWQSFNVARNRAKQLLRTNTKQLEANRNYLIPETGKVHDSTAE